MSKKRKTSARKSKARDEGSTRKRKDSARKDSARKDSARKDSARKPKARKAPKAQDPSESGDERSLEAKARLTAAKLLRRLRKSVSRDGRAAPSYDEQVLPLLGRVGEQVVDVAHASLDDDRWEARFAAVTVLSYLCRKGFKLDEAVAEELVGRVRDEDSQVRYAAVELLGRLRPHIRLVMPGLVKALGDRNAEVSRAAVAQVLELSPSRRALTKTMIKVLEGKRSQLAKIGAMMVLFHLGKTAKEAAPVLLPFLDDESPEVREYAHLALMGIRTPSMRIQIERTASMRLKVKDELASEEELEPASGHLTEEELDELSELGEVDSELGSAGELEEAEPTRARAPNRKKGVAPRKRRGIAAKRRRRF